MPSNSGLAVPRTPFWTSFCEVVPAPDPNLLYKSGVLNSW